MASIGHGISTKDFLWQEEALWGGNAEGDAIKSKSFSGDYGLLLAALFYHKKGEGNGAIARVLIL